jgi:hypothetical protein
MKRYIIKKFLTRYNKDSGEDAMPKHLWHRWYGIDGKFYKKLWAKLDGDNDEYLFDDFCDISFDVKMGKPESISNLPKHRLNKLFLFSLGMYSHYLLVNTAYKIVEFCIEVAYRVTMRP